MSFQINKCQKDIQMTVVDEIINKNLEEVKI
jgi:hypothetical protein